MDGAVFDLAQLSLPPVWPNPPLHRHSL